MSKKVYFNAKELSTYLDLNEKKIYALASENKIPATKITGKWIFSKELIDQWIILACHNGSLSNKIIIAGSDDPLLTYALAQNSDTDNIMSIAATNDLIALKLLHNGLADVCALSSIVSLDKQINQITQFDNYNNWLICGGYTFDCGLIVSPNLLSKCQIADELFFYPWRFTSNHMLMQWLNSKNQDLAKINIIKHTSSAIESASYIAMGYADIAFGTKALATQFGLAYIPQTTGTVNFVLPKPIFFRRQFQELISKLANQTQDFIKIGNYSLSNCGKILWGTN